MTLPCLGSRTRPRILLAAESLTGKNSGIGRVARLMAKAFDELAREAIVNVRAVSLSDPRDSEFDWPWVTPCAGRRFEYVLRVQSASMSAALIGYDSLSMGRSHFMGVARRRPAMVWMHGIEVWENARHQHLTVARRANLLLTNSEFTRKRATSLHTGLDHARVCWLGTETNDALVVDAVTDRPPAALILSRIDQDSYKGHRELIEAWPAILRCVPGARLLIAGAGPGFEEVRRLVQGSPVTSSIELTGFVPESALPAFWERTSVFVMPSRGEGFGLVYIEAMRHGLPVIASRQDAGQEINVDGETGFNVDLTDPAALVEALVALLGDRSRARTMGRAGLERWQRHFTWRAFRERFLGVLADENIILGESRTP